MEIGKDQHQEAFMCNVDEDFRDDEEDEDENRFIISLDDIEVKEDSLDECDNCCKEQEDTRAGHSIAETCAISPRYPKTTLNAKSQNVVNAEVNREAATLKAKSFKFQLHEEQVSETFPSIIVQNSGSKSISEGNNLISIRSKNVSCVAVPNNKDLDSDNKECNGSFKSTPRDGMTKHSISADMCNELSSGKTDADLRKKSKSPVKHRTFTKFTPHENCSCIMCYQGRGIIGTDCIPKAAKRKMSVSVSQVPPKAMKQTFANIERYTNTFSDAQNDCGKESPLSSQKVHVPSTLQLQLVCNDSSPPVSLSAVPSNSSTAREPQICSSNYFVPISGRHMLSCKSTSSVGNPSTPLPVLTPKPPSHVSSTSSVITSPSIASNLSSQGNVTLPAKSLPLTTSSSAQMHPLASDKTHVVLINKSTVERQLTDLNCILQRATKVDLSKPGMALVHFKLPTPISNTSMVSAQTCPPISSLQSSMPSSYKYTGNTLYGLVKHHLINPPVSSSTEQSSLDQIINTDTSHKLSQNSLSGVPMRPNLLSKPHFPYSLVNRMSTPGNSSTLPPPPPLQPCPSSTHIGASRSPNQNLNVTDVEKHQTETIVLPLPKSEHKEKSPPQGISVGISKQDELLSSPSLFTFSSSIELSPQKGVMPLKNGLSDDMSNLNRIPQYPQSFQNQLPACDPLSLSSLSSSLYQPCISMKSSSVTSSTCTIPMTTVSSTTNQQSLLHFSSTPSNLPQADSRTHCALLPEKQAPITSRHQQQLLSDIVSAENSNIPDSSRKADSRWRSDLGWINIAPSPTPLLGSTPSTPSQSSVSIVSNVNGLKMKIRFKDKKSDDTSVPSTGHEELPSILPMKSSHNADEGGSFKSDIHPQDASKEHRSSFASEVLTNASVSVGNNSIQTGNTSKAIAPMETAEEMFKRFEDQAMQQVYNAQFGVGEVQRNLRRNRPPFAAKDHLYSYAQVKTNSVEPSSVNQSGICIQRKRAVKSKRRASGDNRQKLPDEKHNKIDINEYPKLMQDNSIVNRKTVFTPNILAGHKVYVKFNVFSNNQSGRSFLAPFFNIGGSRTQFDVEDMEYINKAVVEFEKEEKSCARHLLFYSREGSKAVFLRKESGLHSNELSPKSYKKHSYILEGYTRERPKQTYQLSEKWKVDNKVQIEIDRAEQDSEIDLQSGHTKVEHKSSDQTTVELRACESSVESSSQNDLLSRATENNSLPFPSPICDFPNAHKSCTQKACEGSVDLHKTVSTTVPKEHTYSHRDFVNILKKRERFQRKVSITNDSNASLSSVKKSSSVPESHHPEFTEQPKELIVSGNLERNVSLSTSGTSFDSVVKRDSLKENLKDHTRENISETVSHIKTEVPDDEYEGALNFRGNKVNPTLEIPGLTIKSEPIDDYTESLARSMNVSLQRNHTSGIETPAVGQKDVCGPDEVEDLPLIKSPSVDNTSKTNVEVQPKAFSDLKEALNVTQSVVTAADVSHSCPNIAVDKILSAESESMETTSNPEESSKMASSSEDETSEEEESDEDTFPFISSLSSSKSTNASSVLNDTNTPAASRKINSLVESLAQRLSQNSVTLPSLFPTPLPQKKRKRKKDKILRKHPDSKQNSLPLTSDLVKDVASVQSFPANRSQHMSLNSSIVNSKTITVTACGITTSMSRVDMRPLSSSHLSSGLSPPLRSFTSENSFSKMSGEASEIRASSFKSKGDEKKGSELLYNDVKEIKNDGESENSSHSLTNDSKGISQLSGNGIKSIESCCSLEPKMEDKDFACERTCKVSGIVDDAEITEKEQIEITDSGRFPMDTHSDDEVVVDDILSQHGEGNLLSNHDSEIEVCRTPKSDSNRSTPCSEIDVGMDELLVERPVRCDSVPFGNLLASPPVPFKGKVCIKDFTREHDLMVPFETGPKPEPNSHAQSNVKPKRSSPTGLSTQRNRRSENKVAKAESEEVKTGSSTQTDLHPSIASLLCEKLAIEVEPVIPKPKAIKASTVFTNSKAFALKEQPVPSVGKTSFYKPTLSAIFGVDNLSLPCPEKRKEEENKSTPVVLTRKRRQVAVKGIHSLRRSQTCQKVSPLKMRKQCGQEERQKENNTKTPNPHTSTSIRKQKVGLQSVFRTWRQLSHEERKKKQMKGIGSQQFCTIPCKVVIERLEDMQLRTNGQPVKTECDTDENPAGLLAFENKGKEQRSLNVKKRRKRTSVKVQRKRQPKEKKDIVDYYASILENLRKKAQMLEEEDSQKKESNTEKKKCEMERIIKVEPITFQDDSGTLMLSEEDGNKDFNLMNDTKIEFKGENCLQHVDKCEQIQDADNNKNTEDILLGEDQNVSVIDTASHIQDPVNYGSMSKTSICLQKSQSANKTHTTGNTCTISKCLEWTGKEDKSLRVDTDNQSKAISDDLNASNVSSSALRGLHEHDLKRIEGSPTDITQSSTKNSLLPFSSNTEVILRNEQFVKRCPVRTSNEDDLKTDPESRQTPDSSFKTKDIVLGFENELVGDTDFSTSQGEMEDLFLLEDGEEDSSMGMIPPEEVEKLLGLDLTSEGGFDSCATKQQKADSLKTSSALPSGNSDGKLQWVPLLETKEKSKDVVDKKEELLPCQEIVPGNVQVQKDSPKHHIEESASDGPDLENDLQSQQKKHQVSPSWNRLLGSEALRKMEKSVPTSSQPIVDQQNNSLPSTSQLRVKFNPGALSRALKLSAEMKKVFADGYSKDALDQLSTRRDKTKWPESLSYECPSETSDVDHSSASSDELNGKRGNMRLSQTQSAQVGDEGDADESTFVAKAKIVHVQNDNQGCNTGTKNEGLQRETRKRSRSKFGKHIFKSDCLEKVSDSNHTDSSACKTNATGVYSKCDPFIPPPNGLQSSSIDASLIELPVKTPDSETSPAVPTLHVRGIDLNKLKLKLNPLFSANKRAQSAIPHFKNYSLSSQILNDKSEERDETLTKQKSPRLSLPDGHLESEHQSVKTNLENATCDELPKTKDSNMNQLGKQRTESEPMLNTVKLCNILKNVIRPNSLPKSLKSFPSSKASSYQGHSSMKSKNKRRLRSSPRSMKSSKDPSDCGMVVHSISLNNEGQKDEKKKMEEDKTERSFFDCLPGVISGAWDKS